MRSFRVRWGKRLFGFKLIKIDHDSLPTFHETGLSAIGSACHRRQWLGTWSFTWINFFLSPTKSHKKRNKDLFNMKVFPICTCVVFLYGDDFMQAAYMKNDSHSLKLPLIFLLFSFLLPVLSGCGFNTIPTNEEKAHAAWSEVLNQYQRR